jgi:hypothetical protein
MTLIVTQLQKHFPIFRLLIFRIIFEGFLSCFEYLAIGIDSPLTNDCFDDCIVLCFHEAGPAFLANVFFTFNMEGFVVGRFISRTFVFVLRCVFVFTGDKSNGSGLEAAGDIRTIQLFHIVIRSQRTLTYSSPIMRHPLKLIQFSFFFLIKNALQSYQLLRIYKNHIFDDMLCVGHGFLSVGPMVLYEFFEVDRFFTFLRVEVHTRSKIMMTTTFEVFIFLH